MPGYDVSSSSVGNPDELEAEWRDLQCRSKCSFFQSWGWIGVWLKQIAAGLQPVLVRVRCEGKLVGMGIFVPRDIRRRYLFRSNALYLHEYPCDGRNMVIEYNGLLAARGHEQAVYARVIEHLFQANAGLDELYFGGIDEDVDLQDTLQRTGGGCEGVRLCLLEESPAWSVNLEAFGEGLDAYLATLSKNRRAQIRRSLREYESSGRLLLEEALDCDAALDYLDGLKQLHTQRWQKQGAAGVFANPVWEAFHRAVIREGFPEGTVQLLKVGSGKRVAGYLYNLVWRNHVYVVQTGFEAVTDKRLMPGYVVHALAVVHNRARGMTVYDLMHGDSLYKRILCNQSRTLRWVVLQRPRFKFALENLAVAVVRRWRSASVRPLAAEHDKTGSSW